MKELFKRFDAMIDRVVESENFLSKRGRLQPVRLKAVLELLRGYITVAAIFIAASAIVKIEKSLSAPSLVLYGLFFLVGFFLMMQTCYLLLTACARAVLGLQHPRNAVAFTRRLRSKSIWPKGIVYAAGLTLLFLYWRLLESLLQALVHVASKT